LSFLLEAELVLTRSYLTPLQLVEVFHHRKVSRGTRWYRSFSSPLSLPLCTFSGSDRSFFPIQPHDTYGMTSLSVRQYVEGIYDSLNWNEKEVTKVRRSLVRPQMKMLLC
jgi:hypothetical protein